MQKKTKKKFRILTTLVAMALSFALMCFGIFAATNVKYTASNTLTFNAEDVATTVSGYFELNGGTNNQLTFPGGADNDGSFTMDYNHGSSYTGEVTLPNFDFAKVTDIYRLHITVKNDFASGSGLNLTSTLTTTVTGDTNGYITVEYDVVGSETRTISPDGTTQYVVAIFIDPDKQSDTTLLSNGFNNITFAFELTITRA